MGPLHPASAEQLADTLTAALGDKALRVTVALGELTVVVSAQSYHAAALVLRDTPGCQYDGRRYCVASHLLSVSLNQRVRLKVFCEDDDFPVIASVNDVWNSANWFEREAFDLFGIIFEGHNDLRRILTDYGFIGHPFRKDFPTTGYVEMRYDPEQRRVIYQPVTIEPREITPRVIREDNYGGLQ
jgi:NADH-quinone oxidoreductase subunit C